MTVRFEVATEAQVPRLHAALARLSQDLGDTHRAGVDELRRAGFGAHPAFRAVLASEAGETLGVALYSPSFSTATQMQAIVQRCRQMLLVHDDRLGIERPGANDVARDLPVEQIADVLGLGFHLQDDVRIAAGEIGDRIQDTVPVAPHQRIRRLTGADMVGALWVESQGL